MTTILNLLWFVLGGFIMGLGWWIAGVAMALSIVGLPWARACFTFGTFCLFPFGREAIDRRELTGKRDLGTGTLGFLGNVIWFCVAGCWLAIGHLTAAVANFAVTCEKCRKPTWAGCGAHVEQVLGHVPTSQRCAGHAAGSSKASPTAPGSLRHRNGLK